MSRIIEMHLNNRHFEMMVNGSKRVEVRLRDEKRQSLRIGDLIEFKNITTGEVIKKKVKRIHRFPMPYRLLGRYRLQDFGDGYKETKDLVEEIHSIYSLEEINKYGIVAIELSEVE